jgi:hypothetical protein
MRVDKTGGILRPEAKDSKSQKFTRIATGRNNNHSLAHTNNPGGADC